MITDVGKLLNLFSNPIDWQASLYCNPPTDPHTTPDKLLSVALYPYMVALRECAQQKYVGFPMGERTNRAELPEEFGGGEVGLPFLISKLTPQQALEHDRLAALYLPLQHAGLVDAVLTRDGGIEAVSLSERGKTLLERLECTGYFDK